MRTASTESTDASVLYCYSQSHDRKLFFFVSSPDVPPDAHVEFEVELVNVEDAPDYSKLPLKEVVQIG